MPEGTEEMFEGVDPVDLQALAAAGWGEGDHQDPHIPPGLLELHVAIEADEADEADEAGLL